MMRKGFRMALAGLGLALLARAAQANPGPSGMIFDEDSLGMILVAFFAWLIVGGILRLAKLDLTHFELAGYVLFFFFLIAESPDMGMVIWTCYIGLLVAYYVFPRAGVPRRARLVNLGFHGCFLLAVVMSGLLVKVSYFRGHGGYDQWIDRMREFYFPFLFMYLFVGVPVGARVYSGVVCKHRKRAQSPQPVEAAEPSPGNPEV